jgi:mono/diheme cytochrome c family protein
VASERDLPLVGTEIPLLPTGEARALAQSNCLVCHSSDMIQQQQLSEKQWVAEVDKMQRWGAEILDDEKPALVAYLVSHFGPDNDRFTPIVARPTLSSSGPAPH